MGFTCDLDVADVLEGLAEAETGVHAGVVDGLIDLDVGAHEGDAALDALGDQLPAAIEEIVEIVGELALSLCRDTQSLREVAAKIGAYGNEGMRLAAGAEKVRT